MILKKNMNRLFFLSSKLKVKVVRIDMVVYYNVLLQTTCCPKKVEPKLELLKTEYLLFPASEMENFNWVICSLLVERVIPMTNYLQFDTHSST